MRIPKGLPAARLLPLCMVFVACAVHAEGGLLLVDAPPLDQAHLSYGGAAFAYPSYPGSASLSVLPIPAFEWTHPSGIFVSTDIGVGWNLSPWRNVQFGARLWPDLARRSSDGARLRGLRDIPLRVERTLFANWEPVPFAQLQSSLRTGLGPDARGTMLELGASIGAPVTSTVLLGLTAGVSRANTAWRQAFFGILPDQTQASGLPVFYAGAGWQDFQTAVGGEWQITHDWRLDVRLENWRLLGAAAASPLTESRWQHGLVLNLWHDLNP